jgi:hypothetical protein
MAAGLGSIWWQYPPLFLTVAASWAGVPLIGTTALGAAAVAASQRRLDLAAVIVVSVIAGEAAGLAAMPSTVAGEAAAGASGQAPDVQGEHDRARRAVVCPVGLAGRVRHLGHRLGTAKMPPYRFALWNLLDALGWTVSVAASAYGVGRLATGHHTLARHRHPGHRTRRRGTRHRHRHRRAASPQAHGPASCCRRRRAVPQFLVIR